MYSVFKSTRIRAEIRTERSRQNELVGKAEAARDLAAGTSNLLQQEFYETKYLPGGVICFPDLTYYDLVGLSAAPASVPDSKSLDIIIQNVMALIEVMDHRSLLYGLGMEYLVNGLKRRPDDYVVPRADVEQRGK